MIGPVLTRLKRKIAAMVSGRRWGKITIKTKIITLKKWTGHRNKLSSLKWKIELDKEVQASHY